MMNIPAGQTITRAWFHETRTEGPVVPSDQTPTIGDLVPGAVIYRFATIRGVRITSELPCHRDQMASIAYDPKSAVRVDQPVVCRRCFRVYAATPVSGTDDFAWYRIVYRYIGDITMSRPRRRGE
jgi:hypothetical protein